MTRDEIKRSLFGPGVSSYRRMAVALGIRDDVTGVKACPLEDLSSEDRFFAIGHAWVDCDNIARYRQYLAIYFGTPRRDYLDAMMTPDEIAEHRRLPEVLTIYRGCYPINKNGLSWSLGRTVAAHFPFLSRYRRSGEAPILLTGRVRKARVVIKLGRGEQEVVVARVYRCKQEPLDG
jgi:hypothetical protein